MPPAISCAKATPHAVLPASCGICVGQTNTAIAAKLFISAKTVDHHVSAVLAKLASA